MPRLALGILLCAALLALAPDRASAQQTADDAPKQDQPAKHFDLKDAQTYLDGLFRAQMQARNIPGACLAVVKDGQIVLLQGYGLADTAQNIPVDPRKTLFRVGSVSKLFVWTALMQLVEQGKLDLNTDVNTYLGDIRIPQAFSRPVTATDLLRHTPGFEDRLLGINAQSASKLPALAKEIADNIPRRVFEPGTVPAYSNFGAALAGLMVERISGLAFDQYVEQYIFAPLAMDLSTFRQPLPAQMRADMAQGYAPADGPGGGLAPQDFELIGLSPAGALSATAQDMAIFMAAHLQNGHYGTERILKEETAKTMHARLFGLDARLSGMCRGFYEHLSPGRRVIMHDGDTTAFTAMLALSPGDGLGVFMAFNSPAGADARLEILTAFMDRFFPGAPADQTPTSPGAQASPPAKLIDGWYEPSRASFTTLESLLRILAQVRLTALPDGAIEVSPAIYGPARLFAPVGPGLYRNQQKGELMALVRSQNGQVTGFALNALPAVEFLKVASTTGTFAFQSNLLVFCLLAFLSAMLIWPVAALARLGGHDQHASIPAGPAWLAVWLGVVLFAFALFLCWFFSGARLLYGLGPAHYAGLALPFAAALLALGVLAYWVQSFLEILAPLRRPSWSFFGRLHYTLLALAGAWAVWLLWRWNFLKPPF